MGDGKPSPFLTMEKKEIYKIVNERYEVILHQDNSEINLPNYIDYKSKIKKTGLAWYQKEKFINSQEKFVEHFANKLASVHSNISTAVIEKTGDKVSLKFFHNEKYRIVGNHWFQKNRSMMFITLNIKTGILYSGSIFGLHNKKRKKKIHTNKFWGSLENIFETVALEMADKSNFQNRKIFLDNLIKLFFEQIPDWPCNRSSPENFTIHQLKGMNFYRYFLSKKGVKIPDNFNTFDGYDFYVPSKYFKKTDNKYIDALLLFRNLTGDKFRKAFHELGTHRPTLYALKFVVDLVGKTRIEQNYEYLKKYLKYKHDVHPIEDTSFLTDTERKNIWLILTKTTLELATIRDHVKFLAFLREKGLNFKWKAKNETEFAIEHKLLSDNYAKILYGVTHRVYPEKYHEWFKEPVEVGGKKYVVQILDKHDEFYHESDFQQNCVKTYISNPGSFIISIRYDKERATVEYYISQSETLWHIDRIQALGRFNKILSNSWDVVLEAVDKMVVEMIGEYGYNMTLNIEKFGNTREFELTFNTSGRPIWDNPLELVEIDDYFPF